ncbi:MULTISPECIES: hypothetical protein [unclassified Streptomyces]|uniref:hypothetical protein n=1 Tax=unclassified Streptomyces TaxID=2593676 RepID=UPI000448EE6F|nr:hypothetical protein [Streptomyces sp. PCS3-D2]WKV74363.1 hypothetical protein AW27_024320 [Streptomyces sp. PCS3-D2]
MSGLGGLILGFFFLFVSCGILWVTQWMARRVFNQFCLKRHGVRTEGRCLGYVSMRDGSRVVVTYQGPSGGNHKVTLDSWEGMLPPIGGPVPLTCLPTRPHVAEKWPIQFFVLRAAVAFVFVPILGWFGLGFAAAGALLIFTTFF